MGGAGGIKIRRGGKLRGRVEIGEHFLHPGGFGLKLLRAIILTGGQTRAGDNNTGVERGRRRRRILCVIRVDERDSGDRARD